MAELKDKEQQDANIGALQTPPILIKQKIRNLLGNYTQLVTS